MGRLKRIILIVIVSVLILLVGRVLAINDSNRLIIDKYFGYLAYWNMESTRTFGHSLRSEEVLTAPAPVTPDPKDLSVEEKKMIDLVNAERIAQGLKPLQVDMRLVKLARIKAEDMIINRYFDHQSPTLGSPFDQMRSVGIDYAYAGENLANSPTVDEAQCALLASPDHRANILKARYTHIGVGVVDGGFGGKMYVQHFIQVW